MTNKSSFSNISDLQDENKFLRDELSKVNAELISARQELKGSSEGALRKQKERFLGIIKSMRDGLCVLDEIGIITYANPVAEKLLEFDSLVGENFMSFIELGSKNEDTHLDINSDNPSSKITTLRSSGGIKVPIKSSWSTLVDEKGNKVGHVVVFNDYSLELEVQRRLEQARDRAVEMTKLKSEFLATMSHEIRTPLNGIISLVSLLEMSNLDEEQREDLADLKASSGQLQEIISNVLDLSKIEAGKMYLDYQKFSLNYLIKDIGRIFSTQFEAKRIVFVSECIGEIPQYVSADYTRLKQVLVNLIGNSTKFTGVDGCVVLLVNGKNLGQSHFELDFSVIDTGVGIPSASISSLFNAFSQADGSITRNFGGTGLGLSICKNLVDLMGGQITVRSKEGIGTAFSFKLNLEEPSVSQESLARLKAISAVPTQIKARMATVLVVDDNQINLSTTTRFLKKYGLNTFSASSGDEALSLTAKEDIDLVLLDLHMPNMSGYEVTRCIRESGTGKANLPILAITADVLESTKQACLDAGFTGFFTKPLCLSELVKSIDSILGNLKSQRQ